MAQFRKRKSDGQAFPVKNKRATISSDPDDRPQGMRIGKGFKVPNSEEAPTEFAVDDLGTVRGEPVVALIRDFTGTRSRHKVSMDIELKHEDKSQKGVDGEEYHNPLVLSISDSIWQRDESDILTGGQGQDELRKALKEHKLEIGNGISNKEFEKLLDIWDNYHLNDMKAGTARQNEIIEKHKDEQKYKKYDQFLDRPKAILEDHDAQPDLETKGFGDEGYSYGSSWLYEPLPDDVVDFVKDFKSKLEFSAE